MQVVLVMFRGEGERRSFSIARDTTVVGRREDCDFRIPLGEISRKHCRLMKGDDGLHVEDMGSSNGTFHNGQRIQQATLQPGDTLQVGSVTFVVQIDGVPTEDEMHPVTAGDRRTAAPGVDPTDVTLNESADARTVRGNGHGDSHSDGNGEFDPMSVLEAGNSGALPAIGLAESSAGSEGVSLNDDDLKDNSSAKPAEDSLSVIDLAENSQAGDLHGDRA
jgi:predicted component of type VI protein secretion system